MIGKGREETSLTPRLLTRAVGQCVEVTVTEFRKMGYWWEESRIQFGSCLV